MTTALQRLTRQYDDADCAYTMPFGLMKQDTSVRAGACHHIMPPISCFVQGWSMPIFRGGPPRSG